MRFVLPPIIQVVVILMLSAKLTNSSVAAPGPDAPQKICQLKIGDIAPDLLATTNGGQPVVLKELKKKVILIEFWSQDDKARRNQVQTLRAIRQDYLRDSEFIIISVCVDGEWDDFFSYCQEYEAVDGVPFNSDFKWWQSKIQTEDADREEIIQNYQIGKTPAYFLLKENNELTGVQIPQDQLRDRIDKLLRK